MLGGLKEQWCKLRRGHPGHRFQERFERNRRVRSGRSGLTRFLKPAAGIVLVVAGVAFCFIPGPGVPLLLVGAGLLADVSRPVARAMDWLEVRVRNVASWGGRWWNHASKTAKYAVIVLAVFVASGAAYGGFRIVMARMH
jgi:putative transmembrane protein PGPGW